MSVENSITTDFQISVVNDLKANLRQAAINFNKLHNLYERQCARRDELTATNHELHVKIGEIDGIANSLRRDNTELRYQNREAHKEIRALRAELTALRQQRDAQNAELDIEMDAQAIANKELGERLLHSAKEGILND